MALTRYWEPTTCRHFALLIYLLLGHFRFEESGDETSAKGFLPPMMVPEAELAVYTGRHYALLTASHLLTIVFDNIPT